MSRVLHIARRELLELRRQWVMLALITTLLLAIATLAVVAASLISFIAAHPAASAEVARSLPGTGDPYVVLEDLAEVFAITSNFLLFGQFLGIAAVLAGHTVLHDRQCGTLPFLLLSPVRRIELLLGKVLGALALPYAMFAVVSTVAMGIVAVLPITENFGYILPPTPGWLVAFWVAAPVWAAFICSICAIVSSLARDVRTAQQAVWFVMFFATLVLGLLLTSWVRSLGVELAITGVGLVATAGVLFAGSQIISRDLGR